MPGTRGEFDVDIGNSRLLWAPKTEPLYTAVIQTSDNDDNDDNDSGNHVI